ncbi:MAG: hypothetical protein CME68_09200 [Halobacteriovoraceae bacterium]|nr:hypothetical protein [Halobacteriovoraceae bacterium]
MGKFNKLTFWKLKKVGGFIPLLLIILVLTSSCSRIKWAYRFSDWFIQMRLESYFDLNSEQIPELEKNIQEYKKWHQKEMLPKYASFLEEVRKDLKGSSITPKIVQVKRLEMEGLGFMTAKPWVDSSVKIYLSLNSSQIKKFEEKIKEDHEERLEKLKESSLAEMSLKRARRMLDFMDIGIKEKQEKIFKEHFKKHPFPFNESYARRKKWNETILTCLKENKNKEKKSLCIKDHFLNWDKRRTPESKAYRVHIDDLIARVLNSLDKEQKASIVAKVGQWIEDFRELAKEVSEASQ